MCRLVHINAIYRHGTRAPSNNLLNIAKILKEQLEGYNLQDYNFTLNSKGNESFNLLPTGIAEMSGLAKRLLGHIPPGFISHSNVRVFTSPKTRAQDSAKAFINAFFKKPSLVQIEEDSWRLRFFEHCNFYAKQVRKNRAILAEYFKFIQGPEIAEVLKEMTGDNHLEELNLNIDQLIHIYKICSHEVSVMQADDTTPGWCKLFRPNHFYVLEFLEDIKHYWTKSYPYKINYEQSCPLLGTILEQLHEASMHDMNPKSFHGKEIPPRGVFWFGHAETLVPVITMLGLFNETHKSELGGGRHLSADGLNDRLDRIIVSPTPSNLFRTSNISPFSGNLVLSLYHCPQSEQSHTEPSLDEYYLEIRLNEKVVPAFHSFHRGRLSLSTLLSLLNTCRPANHNQDVLCATPRPVISLSRLYSSLLDRLTGGRPLTNPRSPNNGDL